MATTRERIVERVGRSAAGAVALIGPPPGSGKTGSALRAQETAHTNIFFGVGRHEQAAELVDRSRTESCQCGVPRASCPRHTFTLYHDFGRNPDNCCNFNVVQAANDAGYGARVGRGICGTEGKPICFARLGCPYHEQFARWGSHVAPAEVILSRPSSTEHTTVVFFDDVDSSHLVQRTRITAQMLKRAADAPRAKRLKPLIQVLTLALDRATADGAYHRDAYDLLDDASRQLGSTLEAVLAAVPPASRLTPKPTIEAYAAAPPGQLIDLLALLHEEFPLWRDGGPMTSGLRIHAGGFDVATMRKPTQQGNGVTSLTGQAVTVFSSTPDPVLRQWVSGLGLEVCAEYTPHVALPHSVRVIQDVGGFYGKGSTEGNDNDGLIAKARAYLHELGALRPAVVTHMHLRERVSAELAIPIERVLYFGNVRGSNAVRDADALLVIGTPGMSPTDAYWSACAAFRGEGAPPSQRMVMRPLPYGGWHDAHGRGREIEVLTFADQWVAEIYESARRDELVQAIFRCRPFDVPDHEQLPLGWSAADDPRRRALTVVLLSAYPIAGLRVDELRFSGNAERAEEATQRMDDAVSRLSAGGVTASARTLAEAAGTSKDRANNYLQQVSAACPPTCKEIFLQVGGQGAETAPAPTPAIPATRASLAPTRPSGNDRPRRGAARRPLPSETRVRFGTADVPSVHALPKSPELVPTCQSPPSGDGTAACTRPGYEWCRGGCGKPMPAGQKCSECAAAAVDAWAIANGRRGSGATWKD